MNRTLMAIGAHADDLEICIGGTLLKYHQRGYRIVYVMATNNMSGRVTEEIQQEQGCPERPEPAAMMKIRKSEAAEGAAAFGAEPVHLDHPQRQYNGPDGSLISLGYGCPRPDCVPPNVPTILTAHEDPGARERLTALILEEDPEYILTHGLPQKDMEHVGACMLVTKSYWDAVERGYKGGLLHWRDENALYGPGTIRWDTHIDISGFLEDKLKALGRHRSQMPNTLRPDHPVRLRSVAWGTACGCREAAETFTIVKAWDRPDQHLDFSMEIEQHRR